MLNDLGNAYVAAGDVSSAIDKLREAVEGSDAVVKAWVVLNDLGKAYVAAGDVSNAIDTLRKAVELQPGGEVPIGACAERSGQCAYGQLVM